MTRFEQLPPRDQRLIRAARAARGSTLEVRALPAPADRHITDTTIADGHNRWMCVPCGEIFKAWAGIERHVDAEHGGGRIQLLWE